MYRTTPTIATASWDTEVRDWDYITSTISVGSKKIVPTYSLQAGSGYVTLVSSGEQGRQRRRSKRSVNKRSWQLTFKNRKTEIDRILDFFDYVLGAYGSFTFTCPREDATYTVRIVSDNLNVDMNNFVLHDVSLQFEEIL